MKVPLNWLKKYLPITFSLEKIAHTLTLLGMEVESIDQSECNFTDVIIAKIDSVSPHPNADRLKIAKVFDGKSYYQIVCGDSSIEAGMVVALAKPGAVLGAMTIKVGKLRGIDSEGMLASLDELGLCKEKVPTIFHLPPDAPLGKDLKEYLYNPIFDITLTPNLGHCRSILGIARELSAALQIPYTLPRIPKIAGKNVRTDGKFRLTNRAEEYCPIYAARLIEGVKVSPSPSWLTLSLESAGVRPVNNIVDVTNYVMLELGQPMHAFDADKLPSKHIVIDLAKKGCSITTLDQKTHQIPEGTLLIQDDKTPIAIAGIMGSLESSITEATTDILLEAAVFSSNLIRQKSRELSLRSESSSRFENEVDRGEIERAMDRAAGLIVEIAGGNVAPDSLVSGSLKPAPRFISARISHIQRLLGIPISLSDAVELLKRLEFEVTSDEEDLLHIKPPSYRNDVHLEVDIIEEVGRLYGYNNIPRKSPLLHTSTHPHNPFFLLERELKKRLAAEGLQEFITCNLISPELHCIELENGFSNNACINVLKPSSQDQSILRSSLLPGHLLCLSRNKNLRHEDVAAFEIGHVHFKASNRFEEKMVLGILLSGKNKPHHFQDKPRTVDFFDLKGILENIFRGLLIQDVHFTPSSFKGFHPFQQAAIHVKEERIGVIGTVHPETLEHFDIEEPVIFTEIELSALTAFLHTEIFQKPLPELPSSERDLTITLEKKTSLSSLFEKIDRLTHGDLKKVELLDIYEDPSIGEDNKNVTFRFTYRSDETTLDYETVEKLHKEVIQNLIN